MSGVKSAEVRIPGLILVRYHDNVSCAVAESGIRSRKSGF